MTNFIIQPWHLLVTVLVGMANEEQQHVVEYLRTENQVIEEKLGKKRILLNDDQRRRLAAKGKILGRKAIADIATICCRGDDHQETGKKSCSSVYCHLL